MGSIASSTGPTPGRSPTSGMSAASFAGSARLVYPAPTRADAPTPKMVSASPAATWFARQVSTRNPNTRARAAPAGPQQAMAHEPEMGGGEQRVLRERHARHRGVAQPLLGHVDETETAARPSPERACGLPVDAHRVGGRGARLAAQRREQGRLSVAGDTGDTEDLSAVDREADVVKSEACRAGGTSGRPGDFEAPAMPARRWRPAKRRRCRSDHPPRRRLGGFPARIDASRHPALAQDGRGVAQLPHLVELVGDVEDARSLRGELAQHPEQLAHRGGGEHRGGLVHDQELRLLEQVSHHLDPLPFADGERVHHPRGIDGNAVVAGHVERARSDGVAYGPSSWPGSDGDRPAHAGVGGNGRRQHGIRASRHLHACAPPG